jgi:hypothetical protein
MSLSGEAWEHNRASPAGSALAGMLGAALSGRRGSVSKQVAVPYWMESARWEASGVPTVICGPAAGGMHAADEWADLGADGRSRDRGDRRQQTRQDIPDPQDTKQRHGVAALQARED